ncbi:MAG TPA: hypothetical protein HPP51_00810 [Planctomycetes bacterium]|nr:hypothetical protein [Planctomycetota bacterium]
MIIQIEMGKDFENTLAELSSMGKDLSDAASKGLEKGVEHAATIVKRDYLSGQSLERRTSQLARSVDGWLADKFDGIVGVRRASAVAKYAWLLGDEVKKIVPRNAKFLAIPIGENRTPAGATRFSSPRLVPDGFFVKTKSGRLLFGYKKGTRGKFRPLFTLVKSVTVFGSGALADGLLDSLDDICRLIKTEINKKIGS